MSMSLDDLKEGATTETNNEVKKGTVQETASGVQVITFRTDELAKPRERENTIEKHMKDELSDLSIGIAQSQSRFVQEIVVPQQEAAAEAALLDDGVEDTKEVSNAETVSNDTNSITATMDDYDISNSTLEDSDNKSDEAETTADTATFGDINKDLDFYDDDEDDAVDESDDKEEAEVEQIKEEINKSIKPINNVIDFTQFTISKKPAASAALLKSVADVKKSAEWVLYAAKRPITVSSLNGTELDHFNPRLLANSRNRLNTYKAIYNSIYNHIEDSNKPSSLEAWAKTIPFYDIDHLYFAVYRACYSEHNLVPYVCPECGKTSLINTDINKMVKYATPEIEAEVKKIFDLDTTSPDKYKAKLIQISDDFVAAIKLPTVFSVIFENAALDNDFLNKYSELLGYISYIDALYLINRDTKQLEEVKIKTDSNDFVKTTKRKISTYSKILSSLNSDQYNNFVNNMKELMEENNGISYIQPASKCTYCNADIPESEIEPLDLVFTRHQLGAIGNL